MVALEDVLVPSDEATELFHQKQQLSQVAIGERQDRTFVCLFKTFGTPPVLIKRQLTNF